MSIARNLFGAGDHAGDPAVDWNALRTLNSYRLFVAVVLIVGFIAGPDFVDFGRAMPMGFYAATALYIVVALLFAFTLYQRRPPQGTQAHIHLYTDILILSFAAYTSGGVASGLAVLMIVPVAGAGMLLPIRHTMLFAALATLFILGGELARSIDAGPGAAQFTQAALLGGALFVAAGLAAAVARRGAQSAEIAERRTRDVHQLSALNERIIQQMEAGILVIDPQGMVILANASAWQLLGNPARLEGEALPGVAPGLARAHAEWREHGRAPVGPVQPDAAATADTPGLQVQFTDLGELGTLVSLEDAAFIAEQLQQLKLASLGRLTASIAHEVRNPLGAISHATQLLAESPALAADDQRFTRIILDHCKRVNTIVENVLQLSRRHPVDPEPLDLAAWLDDFATTYREGHGLDAHHLVITPPGPGLQVAFDPDHLYQVVANLCDNALQHGERDDSRPPRLHLRAGHDDTDAPVIDIEDDGRPIDPDRVEGMFEPFYSTRHGGTGLGLFLARELCEANRARLRYRRMAEGNCFRITLAAPGSEAAAATAGTSIDSAGTAGPGN